MKTFKAEHGAVNVNSGQVKLSAEQARPRMHCLKAVKVDEKGAGTYQVLTPIQFKRGESFGFDGEASKNGVLHDPEAEALAQAEDDDKRTAAAVAKLEKEFAAKLKAAAETAQQQAAQLVAEAEQKAADAISGAEEALLARLPADLAAMVRDELKNAQTPPAGN